MILVSKLAKYYTPHDSYILGETNKYSSGVAIWSMQISTSSNCINAYEI